MRRLGIHWTTLGLRVDSISSHLTADKLFPVNPRAITGMPKLSLLLEAKSMSALIIEPWRILVAHTDDLGWNKTCSQQQQTLVQNLNRITKCCTRADLVLHHKLYSNWLTVYKTFLLTQVWNSLSHRNDSQQRGVIWVTYGCYNSNLYYVRNISHQEVKCSATYLGRADDQLIATRHSCEVNGCNTMTICGFRTQPLPTIAIQISHKQERGTHILLPTRQRLMLVNSQEFGNLGQGCGKDWTHIS